MHQTRGSAGQLNISLSQCRNFLFPVPPIAEQREIIRRVDALFAYVDAIETRCLTARVQIDRLPAATLDRAFRGELVPQCPDDEPALLLLKRLQAAQSEPAVKPKSPKPNKKTNMTELSTETVLESIRLLPDDQFTFDELRSQVATDYDALKDIVFKLLLDKQPALKQVFDPERQAMKFIRVKP